MDKDYVLSVSPILYEFYDTGGYKIHPIIVMLKNGYKIDKTILMQGFILYKDSDKYFIKPKELFYTSETELIIHPAYIDTINN